MFRGLFQLGGTKVQRLSFFALINSYYTLHLYNYVAVVLKSSLVSLKLITHKMVFHCKMSNFTVVALNYSLMIIITDGDLHRVHMLLIFLLPK